MTDHEEKILNHVYIMYINISIKAGKTKDY